MKLTYEIEDHGVEHEQYFGGAVVSFTKFDMIATGLGDSAQEAGENALEQFFQDPDVKGARVADVTKLEEEIKHLSSDVDAKGEDTYHYVSIRWKLTEDPAQDPIFK